MPRCGSVDKAMRLVGRPWVTCTLDVAHMGTESVDGLSESPEDAPHHDRTRNYSWHGSRILRFDMEQGRTTKAGAVSSKRKVRLCKKCGKQVREQGGPDACVCQEIGANKRQTVMFLDEREIATREAEARQIDDDWDWLESEWAKAESDGYHAPW